MTPTQRTKLQDDLVRGYELVDGTARLAAMNLLARMGTPTATRPSRCAPIPLIADPGRRWSGGASRTMSGKKSSLTMVVGADGREAREEREIERQDFVANDEEAAELRASAYHHDDPRYQRSGCGRAAGQRPRGRRGRDHPTQAARPDFDLHTMLRLPTGIHAQGVKANVLLRQEGGTARAAGRSDCGSTTCGRTSTSPSSRTAWRADLDDFVTAYQPGGRGQREEGER